MVYIEIIAEANVGQRTKTEAASYSDTDDMEISIANADVGEEVEATSMVAAVGEKMRYNLLKLSKFIQPLCTLGAFHRVDWNLIYDDYL